ncbi:MAG: fibronectin type III domain-containing protein [Treponema sp.]|nr:fibronectin type III domain-containing protein [Treponema sp.]
MKRKSLFFGCLLLLLAGAVVLMGCNNDPDPGPGPVPAAPTDLEAFAAYEQVTLTWDFASRAGILQVEVEWGIVGLGFTDSETLVNDAATLVVSGLINDTPYQFRVRARNSVGWGAWSATVNATPYVPTVPPAAPVISFDADEMGQGEIFVYWAPVSSAAFFNVRYGSTDDFSAASMLLDNGEEVNITTLYTLLTGLSDGTVYHVWVRAGNVAGHSEWVTDSIVTVLGAPANLTVATVGATSLSLTWEGIPLGATPQVRFGTTDVEADSAAWTTNVTLTATTITGLTNNTVYYVWVRGLNTSGAGAWATVTHITLPAAPAGFQLFSSNERLTAQWNAFPNFNANILEFQMEYREVGDEWEGNFVSVLRDADGIPSAAVISGLTNDQAYQVRIRARNNDRNDLVTNRWGAWSAVVSGTPADLLGEPSDPAGFEFTSHVNQGEILLTWGAVIGAETYEVKYGLTNVESEAGTPVSVNIPSVTLTGLANGTEYFVWVRAVNTHGPSDWVLAGSATTLAQAADPVVTLTTGTTPGTIEVTWPSVIGVISHEVKFGTSNDAEAAQPWTTNITATGTTLTGLFDFANYHIWVRAINAVGPSGWVVGEEVTMMPVPVLTVDSFNAETGVIEVSWTTINNPGISISYTLEYDIDSDFSDPEEVTSSTPSHNIISTIGFTYHARVRIVTSEGNSEWSTPVSRTRPLPMSLRMPTITQDSQDPAMRVAVTVGWDSIPGILEYRVWHSTADNVIPTLARRRSLAVEHSGTINLASPSFALPGRYHNTSVYWMWVQLRTERGWSDEHMIPIPTGNIKLNTLTGMPIFNYIYIEMNQTDPRVVLSYALGNDPEATGFAARNAGRPIFDAVILFAANLRDRDCVAERAAWLAANPGREFRNHDCNQTGIHLHFNGNHAFMYGGGMTMAGQVDTFIRPIQAQGIRAIMGLLPDWGGFSFTTMGDWIYEDISPVAGPGHPHLGPQTTARCNRGMAPPANWVDDQGQPYYRFSRAARTALITQIGQEIERLGLDGVDLDCEWANAGGAQYQTLWWTSGWCNECGASHARWNYYSTANLPAASAGVMGPGFGAGTGQNTNRVTWPEGNRWGHAGGSLVTAAQVTESTNWRNTVKANNAMEFIAEMRYVLNDIQQRTGRRQMLTVYEYGWLNRFFLNDPIVCPRSGVNHSRVGDLIDYSTQPFYGTFTANSQLARTGEGPATRYMYSPMAIDLGHGHDTTVRPNWTQILTQAAQLRDGGYELVFMYGLLERQRYHPPIAVSPMNSAYGMDALGNHRRHRPNYFQAAGRNPEDYLTRFTEIVWGQPTIFTGQDFPISWLEFSNDRPWIP